MGNYCTTFGREKTNKHKIRHSIYFNLNVSQFTGKSVLAYLENKSDRDGQLARG